MHKAAFSKLGNLLVLRYRFEVGHCVPGVKVFTFKFDSGSLISKKFCIKKLTTEMSTGVVCSGTICQSEMA